MQLLESSSSDVCSGRRLSVAIRVPHPCSGCFGGPCSACHSPKALDVLLRRLYNMQGRNAFFVLCQHNGNDLACLLSTPAMGM